MYELIEIIGVVSEVLIILLFVQGIFNERATLVRVRWIAFFGFGVGLTVLSFIQGASYVRILYTGIGIIVLSYWLFESKLYQAFFTGIGFCAIYMMIDVATYWLLPVLGLNGQAIMSHGSSRGVYIITTHIVLLVVIMLILLITHRQRSAVTLPFVVMLTPGYVISIVLGCAFCHYVQITGEDLPLSFLLASIGMLYMNILLVFYAEKAKISSDRKRERDLAEQHYEMQEQYYEQLRNEQNDTRALFHDISKHMQAMRAMVAESNAEQAKIVLDEAQKLYSCIGNVVDVGNSVISIILNEYKNKAEEAGVEIEYQVSILPSLSVNAVDCYIIFGNTLDNAIEAAVSADSHIRKVKVQITQHNDTLFYRVENPCSAQYANRKRDKSHGYGLSNVKRCVDKYSGYFTTNIEDGQFVFCAHLNV